MPKILLETATRAGLFVISDEVYSGLVYSDKYTSCGSFKDFKNDVYIIQSCSKNFAMSGWRIGFGLGAAEQIRKAQQFLGQTTTGVSPVCQAAATAAVSHHGEVNSYVKKHMELRRDVFFDTLNHLFCLELEKSPSAPFCTLLPRLLTGVRCQGY